MNRRTFLTSSLVLPAIGLATGAYATVIEPRRLAITRYALQPDQWPRDMPLRIVAIADIHMAPPFMTLERLSGIVEAANALNPDIVVLLGDYAEEKHVVSGAVSSQKTAALLSELRAPLGRWAVMGNHDWASDPQARRDRAPRTHWHDAFEAHGIEVLSNRAAKRSLLGRSFWIAGLESQLAYCDGGDDLEGTLAQIEDAAPVLLLAHEPDIFARMSSRVALTLCGHTHGGQVRLFGRAPIVPSRYGERYAYGHIVEADRHLVVSAGLGCSRLPIRFGVPPELVVIDLGARASLLATMA